MVIFLYVVIFQISYCVITELTRKPMHKFFVKNRTSDNISCNTEINGKHMLY